MKWFRIISPGWQLTIILVLLIFLGWDSMPPLGPDGRIICEVNQHDLFNGRHDEYFPRGTKIKLVEFDETKLTYLQPPLVDNATLIEGSEVGLRPTIKRFVNEYPILLDFIPKRFKGNGYLSLKLSITPKELRSLQDARHRGAKVIAFLCSTKLPF